MDYEAAYKKLFNAITDMVNIVEQSQIFTKEIFEGVNMLIKAQKETEDMYFEQYDK